MRTLTTIAALMLLSTRGLSGQLRSVVEDCDADSDRVLRGLVMTLLDTVPAPDVFVSLPGPRCGLMTGADGTFAIFGYPADADTLVLFGIGHPKTSVYAPATEADDDYLVFFVPPMSPYPSPYDFAALDHRPEVLEDPVGIAGCYWFGGGRQKAKVFHFLPNGRIEPGTAQGGLDGWGFDPEFDQLLFSDVSESGVIRIGPNPDWRALPVTLRGRNFTGSRYFLETFAVRVPC